MTSEGAGLTRCTAFDFREMLPSNSGDFEDCPQPQHSASRVFINVRLKRSPNNAVHRSRPSLAPVPAPHEEDGRFHAHAGGRGRGRCGTTTTTKDGPFTGPPLNKDERTRNVGARRGTRTTARTDGEDLPPPSPPDFEECERPLAADGTFLITADIWR